MNDKSKSENENETKSTGLFILVPLLILVGYTVCVFIFCDFWRNGFIFLISTSFGFILKYGGIGYACSFQSMVKNFNFYQMRILFVVLLCANIYSTIVETINFCPLFAKNCQHYKYSPSQSPCGISLAIGSFLFGIGMILSQCCASGTFIRLGSGNVKTLVVLLFFIIGSTFSVIDPIFEFYSNFPKTDKPVTLHFTLVWLILIALYFITMGIDYLKQEKLGYKVEDADYLFFANPLGLSQVPINEEKMKKWKKHIFFASLLGLVFGLFYLCFGSMIGVSGVFSTIGANFLKHFGVEVEKWKFFGKEPEQNYFKINIFNSDIYLFLGSFIVSAMNETFGKEQENTVFHYIRAVLGGFLMGIGSRMAYGCNIGSMSSGISGNSLHGFIWMGCASIGSLLCVLILGCIEKSKQKKQIEQDSEKPDIEQKALLDSKIEEESKDEES